MAKVPLTVRIEGFEMATLKEFCKLSGRTQSDVIRELVRGLRSSSEDGKTGADWWPSGLVGCEMGEGAVD